MTSAATFLVSLGKHLSAMGLYQPGHRARHESMRAVQEDLKTLLRENAFPVFTFLDGDVIYEDHALTELRQWEWSLKLAQVGVERLEVSPGTTREDLEGFLEEVHARLHLEAAGASVREARGQEGIRFGEVGVDGMEADTDVPVATASMRLSLTDEAAAVGWLHGEAERHGEVPVGEAVAVVNLLSVAMHSERDMVVPLVQLKQIDQYTTSHSINVSCLSMALAEYLNLASTDVRTIGEAALLHDVGKTRIPLEVLNKPGKLTADEWALVQTHTAEGARILLRSAGRMELAALVAYEHHLSWKGEGYPQLVWPRQPHRISRLIQVCDVYDALRTRRPFRPPWPQARAVKYLEEQSGKLLDPDYVDRFLAMMRQWEPRQATLDDQEEEAAA